MKDTLISIGEASKRLGVSIQTLRAWDKSERFVPVKTAGGHRKYRLFDVESFIRGKTKMYITENFQSKMARIVKDVNDKETLDWFLKSPWANDFDSVKAWSKEDIALLVKNQTYLSTIDSGLIFEMKRILNNLIAPYLVYTGALSGLTGLVYYNRVRTRDDGEKSMVRESEDIVSCTRKSESNSLDLNIVNVNSEIIRDLINNSGTVMRQELNKYVSEDIDNDIEKMFSIMEEKTGVNDWILNAPVEKWIVTDPDTAWMIDCDRVNQSVTFDFSLVGKRDNITIYSTEWSCDKKILLGIKSPYYYGYMLCPYLLVGPKKQSECIIYTGEHPDVGEDKDICVMCYAKRLLREGAKFYGLINYV